MSQGFFILSPEILIEKLKTVGLKTVGLCYVYEKFLFVNLGGSHLSVTQSSAGLVFQDPCEIHAQVTHQF